MGSCCASCMPEYKPVPAQNAGICRTCLTYFAVGALVVELDKKELKE